MLCHQRLALFFSVLPHLPDRCVTAGKLALLAHVSRCQVCAGFGNPVAASASISAPASIRRLRADPARWFLPSISHTRRQIPACGIAVGQAGSGLEPVAPAHVDDTICSRRGVLARSNHRIPVGAVAITTRCGAVVAATPARSPCCPERRGCSTAGFRHVAALPAVHRQRYTSTTGLYPIASQRQASVARRHRRRRLGHNQQVERHLSSFPRQPGMAAATTRGIAVPRFYHLLRSFAVMIWVDGGAARDGLRDWRRPD